MAEPAADNSAHAVNPAVASSPSAAVPSAAAPPAFVSATPILASLDIEKTVAFYCSRLGCASVYVDQGSYGIVSRGAVRIHFWPCKDRAIAEATACRIQVTGVDALYAACQSHGIVHPNGPLRAQPWGTREFSVLDEDGNCIAFYENDA